jgi:hypothetical protein
MYRGSSIQPAIVANSNSFNCMDKKMRITKLEQIKAPKGHQPHKSGTGFRKDRRTRRNRTRADQKKNIDKDLT